MKYSDEHIQQQIEAYLNQEMTDLERSKFEKMIHDNPELHEEVELQEAAMEAIRRERILALKAGLSQVPVSLWSTGLMQIAKIAAISAGIATASLGGYYFLERQNHSESTTPPKIESSQTETNPLENAVQTQDIKEIASKTSSFESTKENAEAPEQTANSISTIKESTIKSTAKKQGIQESVVAAVEPLEPNVKGLNPLIGKDMANPNDGISNRTSLESVHPEVVIKKDNKNVFHYQFSDGKLVLYADFSEQLYEVLELNQNGEKQIFFCFDNKFYPLNPNQFEISPLKEVQDKNLIQILKAYQKRRN